MTVPTGRSRESRSNSGGKTVDDWLEGIEVVDVLREFRARYLLRRRRGLSGGLHTR